MRVRGKIVEKAVEKNVQSWWMKNVEKCQNGSFAQKSKKSTKVMQNFIDKFCTKNLYSASLLAESFTLFPHRTTITTTNLIIRDF